MHRQSVEAGKTHAAAPPAVWSVSRCCSLSHNVQKRHAKACAAYRQKQIFISRQRCCQEAAARHCLAMRTEAHVTLLTRTWLSTTAFRPALRPNGASVRCRVRTAQKPAAQLQTVRAAGPACCMQLIRSVLQLKTVLMECRPPTALPPAVRLHPTQRARPA